jgi:predicted transglutaminase-like cysteine proteinase
MGRLQITRRRPNALRAAIACALLAAATAGATIRVADAADSQPAVQLAYAVPGSAADANVRAYPTPFTRTALRAADTELFPKWHAAIVRMDLQLGGVSPASISADSAAKARDVFNRIAEQVAARSGFDRLVAANDLINAVPYRTDQEVYGVSDYWATPIEMLAAGGGDCEDHAIAKLAALKQAGVAADKLRLVVGIDTTDGKAHAMAVVELDGIVYVLDGRMNHVVAWGSAEMHFRPLYAVDFRKAWIYRS